MKKFHFLSSFVSYEPHIATFADFCAYISEQLIKKGSVSDLMKLILATRVERAAVTYEGEVKMQPGTRKPKTSGGGGGGGSPPAKVSVQDMIGRIREKFEISEDEALHIREVTEEKIEDASIRQTVAMHRLDRAFLDSVYKDQLNGAMQDTYVLHEWIEPLCDPKYTDPGAIFDIMAITVIETGLELAEAS